MGAKGDAGDLELTNMFEAFRDRKLEQEQAAQDVVDVQAPAKGEDTQRKTRHPKPEIAGSSPSSPQAVMQSSQDKLRQLMETQKASRNSPGPQAEKNATASEDQRLVVGPRIRLQGDVTNCDTLIIEGHFEGSAKTRMIQVAQGGTVSGEVEVETAEITGEFEGKLTVSNRLVVHATGRVKGTVRYFAVEIEAGGQISGDVQVTEEGLAGPAKTKPNVASDITEKFEVAS